MTNEGNPIGRYSLRYLWTKWQIKRDEKFLLKQGLRKAMSNGLEINIGAGFISTPQNQEKTGRVYLQPCNGECVDATKLAALAADDYPEIARRYLANRKRLGR